MSDGMRFSIMEDTLTKYLNNLSEKFEKREKNILEEMMFSATGYPGDRTAPIARKLMLEGTNNAKSYEYNPYLFKSGQDKSWWTFNFDGNISSVEANYSGMRGYESQDDFKVWIEFSDEFIEEGADTSAFYYVREYYNAWDLHLNRDYAFYQETGADKYANPEDAHHIGYVNRGMGDAANKQIPYTLERMYRRLLRLDL